MPDQNNHGIPPAMPAGSEEIAVEKVKDQVGRYSNPVEPLSPEDAFGLTNMPKAPDKDPFTLGPKGGRGV